MAYFRTQVCVNDLIKVLNVRGRGHKDCPSNCPRRHMTDLLRAPVSAESAVDQAQAVLKDKTVAARVVAAIRADNAGYFSV